MLETLRDNYNRMFDRSLMVAVPAVIKISIILSLLVLLVLVIKGLGGDCLVENKDMLKSLLIGFGAVLVIVLLHKLLYRDK